MAKKPNDGAEVKTKTPKKRLISKRRLVSRKNQISILSAKAQKCEEALAKIDEQLSKLDGVKFSRAAKARLLAKQMLLKAELEKLVYFSEREKALISVSHKHNRKLYIERSPKPR